MATSTESAAAAAAGSSATLPYYYPSLKSLSPSEIAILTKFQSDCSVKLSTANYTFQCLGEPIHPTPEFSISSDYSYLCYRFLRARSFHPAESLAMFQSHIEWRNKFKVDTILQENQRPPAGMLIRRLIPCKFHGYDSENRPIFIEKLGKVDARLVVAIMKGEEEYLPGHIWKMEGFVRAIEEKNGELKRRAVELASKSSSSISSNSNNTSTPFTPIALCEGFTLILDLNEITFGASLKQSGYLEICSKNDKDNYPERLGQMILVNVGWTFNVIWKLVSVLIDERTKKKIHVHYGEPGGELKKLLGMDEEKRRDEEERAKNESENDAKTENNWLDLPLEYGGKCLNCRNTSEQKECIPNFELSTLQAMDYRAFYPDFHVHSSQSTASTPSHEHSKWDFPSQPVAPLEFPIAAGKTHKFTVDIPGKSRILWFFRELSLDHVRFHVSYTDSDGKRLMLEENKEKRVAGRGMGICSGPGKVEFEVDNSFSFMTGKKAFVSYEIQPEGKQERQSS